MTENILVSWTATDPELGDFTLIMTIRTGDSRWVNDIKGEVVFANEYQQGKQSYVVKVHVLLTNNGTPYGSAWLENTKTGKMPPWDYKQSATQEKYQRVAAAEFWRMMVIHKDEVGPVFAIKMRNNVEETRKALAVMESNLAALGVVIEGEEDAISTTK